MSGSEHEGFAHNIVAIFHVSFHPTKGNVVDWCLKSYEGLNLDGVEFSVLPSGLHLVERDTVYFTHGPHSGVALFRRRPTRTQGHRGFRLSAFGILLQDSPHPRPWLHLDSLKALTDSIYAAADRKDEDEDLLQLGSSSGSTSQPIVSSQGELSDEDLVPAREWFEHRKAPRPTSSQTWSGWSDELDGTHISDHTPTHHLPHLLRILGLSSLTLYKFILSRRRIMIFTLPPVEVAGILAWIAADLCREHHASPRNSSLGIPMEDLFSTKSNEASDDHVSESIRVLGMVTLSDMSRLDAESAKGQGWIACTTDAIFLERPQYYDLIIDLTTSTPSKASRPALYMSKPTSNSQNGKRKASYKLETVRFTWSDVKLWSELDRILKLDSAQAAVHSHGAHSHRLDMSCANSGSGLRPSRWTDAFQLYEDVCLLCASLWMGFETWRSNSRASFSSAPVPGSKGKGAEWGAARSEGDDDWSVNGTHMRKLGQGIEGGNEARREAEVARMRTLGKGIEGRPKGPGGKSRPINSPPRGIRKPSTSSATQALISNPTDEEEPLSADEREEARQQNLQTTLALLQTFHANTVFLLSKLHEIVPPPSAISSPAPGLSKFPSRTLAIDGPDAEAEIITVSSRDLLTLELGVMSELDAKFVEWLAEAEGYSGGRTGRRLVIKRGWQELFSIVLGFR